MILHVGHVDDFGEAVGHHADEVGARVFFIEEGGFDVGGGIVRLFGIAHFFRGPDVDAVGHMVTVVHGIELVLEALVDPDRIGLDAHAYQVLHNFGHDHGRRHNARRAGAVHLDAHHIGGCDEAGPGVADVFVAG